jgi:hypothetical protein
MARDIQVWRTREFTAPSNEPVPKAGTTSIPPPETTYAKRLDDIFDCLSSPSKQNPPIEQENPLLADLDSLDFPSSDSYFRGYARIDAYFRPTRSGSKRTSMLVSERPRADQVAGSYLRLTPPERAQRAKQYISCLLERGCRV